MGISDSGGCLLSAQMPPASACRACAKRISVGVRLYFGMVAPGFVYFSAPSCQDAQATPSHETFAVARGYRGGPYRVMGRFPG